MARALANALRGHPPDVVFLCLDNDAMSLRIATTLRKKLLCDEVCQYVADEVNGDWTYFEQTATLSVPGMPTPTWPRWSSGRSRWAGRR